MTKLWVGGSQGFADYGTGTDGRVPFVFFFLWERGRRVARLISRGVRVFSAAIARLSKQLLSPGYTVTHRDVKWSALMVPAAAL